MELPPLRRPLPHEVFYPSPVNRRWIAAQRNAVDAFARFSAAERLSDTEIEDEVSGLANALRQIARIGPPS
jgi:hypothetical protein